MGGRGDVRRRGQVAAAVVVAVALFMSALGITSAWAEAGAGLPAYEGTQFPVIHSAADPEAYSWRVELGPRQTLRSASETEAVVEYPDGTIAFRIHAQKAHDADGTNVPTTIEVSEGDVITVIVHHREAPYAYPVMEGEGWILTYEEPVIVKGPPDEKELEEARRRVESANPAAEISPLPVASATCVVPSLEGLSLRAARLRLHAAHCSIGRIHLAAATTAGKGKVVKQFRAVGTELGAGAPVAVKLGSR